MLNNLLTPFRLKWYPRIMLLGLSIGFIIAILSGDGAGTLTGRLGGDYPAFYGAGRIMAQGDWNELYTPDRLISAQRDLLPDSADQYVCFPYPPYVALFYWPLSLLNYRLSFAIHTLLMVGVLLLTVHIIRPMNEIVDKY